MLLLNYVLLMDKVSNKKLIALLYFVNVCGIILFKVNM